MPKKLLNRTSGDIVYYPWGNDGGNSQFCFTTILKGKLVSKALPTAIAEVDGAKLASMGVEVKNSVIIQLQNEASQWGIGELAMLQSTADTVWTGRGDVLRYANKHMLRTILAASAGMIPEQRYGLVVTGGLPAELYQSSTDPDTELDIRKEVKRTISATWTFSIDNGLTWRECTIVYGGTLMEGAGAAASLDAKQLKDQEVSPLAFIDIGGRTTDLYVARNGVPMVQFCKGRPIGVVTAEDRFRRAFQKAFRTPLSDLDVRLIMIAYANSEGHPKKQYPPIVINGRLIKGDEIDPLVTEAVEQTADEIVSFVASAWRESDLTAAIASRFNPCVLIGGGAWFFFEALHKRIKHLQRHSDPVFANSIGYCRYSQAQIDKKGLNNVVEGSVAALAINGPGEALGA